MCTPSCERPSSACFSQDLEEFKDIFRVVVEFVLDSSKQGKELECKRIEKLRL